MFPGEFADGCREDAGRAASNKRLPEQSQPETAAEAHARPRTPPQFTREEDLHAYHEMLLIRRFERGWPALRHGPDRRILPPVYRPGGRGHRHADGLGGRRPGHHRFYRDHGHMLACGMDPKGVMAELTGRRGGYSRGKGGSMHMFSREKQFFGGHGIVGAQVSLGTGLGFADAYRKNGKSQLDLHGRRRGRTRVRSTRALTWRSSGSCPWST